MPQCGKCICPCCEGNIEYPLEMVGEQTPCPHCKKLIKLPTPILLPPGIPYKLPKARRVTKPIHKFWICFGQNDVQGPVFLDTIQHWFLRGFFSNETRVCQVGTNEWKPLRELEGWSNFNPRIVKQLDELNRTPPPAWHSEPMTEKQRLRLIFFGVNPSHNWTKGRASIFIGFLKDFYLEKNKEYANRPLTKEELKELKETGEDPSSFESNQEIREFIENSFPVD